MICLKATYRSGCGVGNTKVSHLETSLSILLISTMCNKTQKPTVCTVRDPEMAVLNTGKKENRHFAVLP